MKAAEIVSGGTYWHAPHKDWLDYDYGRTYAVEIADASTRYGKSYGRVGFYPSDKGKFLKGRVVNLDGQEIGRANYPGHEVYVLPQSLRGAAAATLAMLAKHRDSKRRLERQRQEAADATAARGAEIVRQMALLGVKADATVSRFGALSLRITEEGANRLLTLRTETEA